MIPHECITFSDKYLQWDTTKFVFRSSQDIFFLPVHWPFTMDKKAVRDIIVVVIYVVFFGLNLSLVLGLAEARHRPAARPPEPSRVRRASGVRCGATGRRPRP